MDELKESWDQTFLDLFIRSVTRKVITSDINYQMTPSTMFRVSSTPSVPRKLSYPPPSQNVSPEFWDIKLWEGGGGVGQSVGVGGSTQKSPHNVYSCYKTSGLGFVVSM